ncbi:hypothetical protein B5E84_11140 [Lachnoclostridium sp. An14]|uniref:GNAT family N-acetyltransferase n=1 Tax=Lachnoclostridium sp. An14 TaxID=1965562 RepID=UPI000B36EBD8|nr:GNAT family N-acetyltransferase [Lachnoclostridium sp. An14]OUQ17004.1 hypothetical protein B5E84_11140 [Lachnoclostridium sp. An14]
MSSQSIRLIPVKAEDRPTIEALSAFASHIVKEHFDPIIGAAQNDYMIARFQTVSAIQGQISSGYRYYLAEDEDGTMEGFLAFYPRDGKMYLSKFYVDSRARGRGIAREMFRFLLEETKKEGLPSIFLNVNRDNETVIRIYEHLGFRKVRKEKNDIGGGFVMDDFVLECPVE